MQAALLAPGDAVLDRAGAQRYPCLSPELGAQAKGRLPGLLSIQGQGGLWCVGKLTI